MTRSIDEIKSEIDKAQASIASVMAWPWWYAQARRNAGEDAIWAAEEKIAKLRDDANRILGGRDLETVLAVSTEGQARRR